MNKTKLADMICRNCKHEFQIKLELKDPNKKFRCPECASYNIRGEKTFTPEFVKKQKINVQAGWFDDVDEPVTDPNAPALTDKTDRLNS